MSVSIITPMYNEALNIENCYRSLCEQKEIKFEWVVIDDGSTDMSTDILRKLMAAHDKDNFTITLIEQKNAGAAAARQSGILCCKFDIITILDADDKLSENALAQAFSKITDSVDAVCYRVHFVDKNQRTLSEFNYRPRVWPTSGREAFSQCIDGWGLTGLFMVKKPIILQAYKYVNSLGLENTINLDELVSRLNMFYAGEIDLCDGIYLYYQNPSSTTKKINHDYHRVIYTALALNDFIFSENNSDWYAKSQMHFLATLWGVYSKYFKWRSNLDNSRDWLRSLNKLANEINISFLLKQKMDLRQKTKIYIKILLTVYLRYRF